MRPEDRALLAAAEQAVTLASATPELAREEAARVMEMAGGASGATRTAGGAEACVVAARALGLACKELGDLAPAMRHLRDAVRLAERAHLPRREGEARMSLVAVLADTGDLTGALIEADRAAQVLTGADAGRLLAQRALVLARAGKLDEALACYRQALPRIRRTGDARFEAGVLLNLGALNVYRGEIGRAEAALRRCEELAAREGLDRLVALAQGNLAFAALRGGDIPRALALLDGVEQRLTEGRERFASARVDRAEALMVARLPSEAREVLTDALDQLRDAGFAADLAEARLLLARAELLDGDPEAAAGSARAAHAAFARQRRTGWAVLAEHVAVLARWESGERSPELLRAAQRSTGRLAEWGWEVAASHSRVVAGRLALDLGRPEVAERELTRAGRARRGDPVDLRVAAWHARALHRLTHGDRRGAASALRAGLRVVDEHAASLGATDLRAHAAAWGQELASLGLRLALESGRPRAVLSWVERWRAGAMRRPSVRPPGDHRLAADLTALRRVTADLTSAAAEGRDIRALRAQQVRLEARIRGRSRHAPGAPARRDAELSPPALIEALGERAFVEYAHHDGALVAVTVVDGAVRLTRLGVYAEALRATEAVRFFQHRVARRHGSAGSLAAARTGLAHVGAQLDALLLDPLAKMVGDRELVIAPTGRLHALPWPALPSLAGRPVTVVPSAAMWLTARAAARRRRSGTVLVAGPGLDHAEAEVATLAARYPGATRLTGADASADAVRSALDGADLAHLAAHGRFRADNPLFSSLDLADGPLMVYDLERLRRAPRRLVLSACDGALSAVRPGDELMGLAAAVLSLGTATLVASVTPVRDEEAAELMLAFHAHLAAGRSPARALAEAAGTSGVLGFVCFGAG